MKYTRKQSKGASDRANVADKEKEREIERESNEKKKKKDVKMSE